MIFKKVFKIDNKKSSSGVTTKSKMEVKYDFSISSSKIREIKYGKYTTYTIPIKRDYPTPDYFENLVITKKTNDSIKTYIIKYVPDVEVNIFKDHNSISFEGKRYIKEIKYDVSSIINLKQLNVVDCTFSYQEVWYNYGDDHVAGPACHIPGDGRIYIKSSIMECTETSVGGGDAGFVPDGTSNNGGATEGNDEVVITAPTVSEDDTAADAVENILTGLTTAQINWLHSNETISQSILDYLSVNASNYIVSEEAENFAKAAVETLMDGSELSFDEIVGIAREMDKICQSDIIYDALFVNSTFNITFFNALIKPKDKHIAFRDSPNSNNVDEVPIGALANTQPTRGYDSKIGDYTLIDFSNNFLENATDLGVATVLYHEMVHAYLVHLYYEGQLLIKYPQCTALNSSMNTYSQNSTAANLGPLNIEMHNVMVDFIDLMAESVHQWSLNNNVSGVNLEYAKKLVWGGLQGYDVFTDNLSTAEQTEYKAISDKETQNKSNAKDTKSCI